MLLKRQRGDEFVPVYEGRDLQSSPVISEQEPHVKRTRTNPPRSARAAAVEQVYMIPSGSGSALPKKTRAPRKKKIVADPVEAAPVQSSSVSQQGPCQPSAPPKRRRKMAMDNGDGQSQPEKRKAQFKPRCPQNILDRVERVMTQR